MDGTLITPSFTSLYSLTGDHSDDIDMDMARRLYRAKVEEAIRLIRPDWTITLDGAIYGPLTQSEAEELHDLIDMIDVDAILAASAR